MSSIYRKKGIWQPTVAVSKSEKKETTHLCSILLLEGQLQSLIISHISLVLGRAIIKGSCQASQSEPKQCYSDSEKYKKIDTVHGLS